MTPQKLKSLIFLAFFSVLAISGYLIGLASHENHAQVPAVKTAILAIDSPDILKAKPTSTALAPLPVQEVSNPFGTGKIIDIPSASPVPSVTRGTVTSSGNNGNPISTDARFTTIPTPNNNTSDIDFSNPLGTSHNADDVIIEVTGMDNNKEKISTSEQKKLKETVLKDLKKAETTPVTPEKKHILDDLYAPRTPLKPAPDSDYSEISDMGTLPKQPIGQTPLYRYYGNPTSHQKGIKSLALIVGGLGTDAELTREAIKTLPPEITLGFVPYSDNLQTLVNEARTHGHEVILEFPLEPFDLPRPDVGDKVLLTTDSPEEQEMKIKWLLSRATGYSGIMNYLGAKYVKGNALPELFTRLKNRGLYFIENKALGTGLTRKIAQDTGIAYYASSDIIDSVLSPSYIQNILDNADKNITTDKPIVLTGYASPLTISLVRNHVLKYRQGDIKLVPISAIVR